MQQRYPAVLMQTLAVRAISISMGFVFFIAGWRRFYNDPTKHDITHPTHIADKLVQAAPGSPIEDVVHWVLYHPWAAEWSVYLFSSVEVIIGLGLLLGFMSRIAAVGSALLNIALMLIFGWMGHECLDEWTMAALGFAISVTIMFTGPGTFSIDHLLSKDWLASWFTPSFEKACVVFSAALTICFYSYYFGILEFGKRTPTGPYRIVAQTVEGQPDRITLYVNGGSSSNFAWVRGITFTTADGQNITLQSEEIEVHRSHFEPWTKGSGQLADGFMRLSLGSKVDISVPQGAKSAVIDLIGARKDPEIKW